MRGFPALTGPEIVFEPDADNVRVLHAPALRIAPVAGSVVLSLIVITIFAEVCEAELIAVNALAV
jgi:hypothetical protein